MNKSDLNKRDLSELVEAWLRTGQNNSGPAWARVGEALKLLSLSPGYQNKHYYELIDFKLQEVYSEPARTDALILKGKLRT